MLSSLSRPTLAAAALLAAALAASAITNGWQHRSHAATKHKLHSIRQELADTRAELANAEDRAAKYHAANQALAAKLAAAHSEAETRRLALQQVLQQHPDWSRQALPDNIRKALP